MFAHNCNTYSYCGDCNSVLLTLAKVDYLWAMEERAQPFGLHKDHCVS